MLLDTLEVHHLTFHCVARTNVHFGSQAGAQLRGALWEALQDSISDTELLQRFITLENPTATRGRNPARPFAIRPPLQHTAAGDRQYNTGTRFSFGMTIFGTMLDLFPYMALGVYDIGRIGVGYGRGQFVLEGVEAVNPLTGETQTLLENQRVVGFPSIPVTAQAVMDYAHTLPTDAIRLNFVTPTQLKAEGKLLSSPAFGALIPRIIERAQLIAENYTISTVDRDRWRDEHLRLSDHAKTVIALDDDTRWIDVRSGSRRANSAKKISGFVGGVAYHGDLRLFLRWLIWGQSLQVGKNVVKGNGWYQLVV